MMTTKTFTTRAVRAAAAAALTMTGIGLVGQPSEASPNDCPSGFSLEPVSVFSASHRSRLTGGKVSNGKVCLDVSKPNSNATCSNWFNSEGAYVFQGSNMLRLTNNGAHIRAGKVCLGIQRPGSTVWDPIEANPASVTIRTRAKSEHRASTSYPNPYRTISNTSLTGCQGQCQIRARCQEFDYNSQTRQCRLWTRAGGRPIYDSNYRVGLKSPKTSIKYPPQPEAARQFTKLVGKSATGRTAYETRNVPSWEVCARRCIDSKPTAGHGSCKAATMGPGSGGMKICRLYDGSVTATAVSAPYQQRRQFILGRKVGKSRDK